VIRVLIVDDSPSVRGFLRHILGNAGLEVAGEAENGLRAVELAAELRPDVITMDMNMPILDGIAATQAIMETTPTPIIIVSGHWEPEKVAETFEALGAGALAILERPRFDDAGFERQKEHLVSTIRLMAEIKVVRRRARPVPDQPSHAAWQPRKLLRRELVAVGASTGGPQALRAILADLPGDFPAPLAVVQHISRGFLPGLVQWLGSHSRLRLVIAEHGQTMKPGTVYFAPDDRHMLVTRDRLVRLSDEPPVGTLRPAIGHLFRSVAETYGSRAVGVLLTGMGREGARELKLMRDRGAVTIAQDKSTSIVYGMPGEAVKLGAATYVLPLESIAAKLLRVLEEPD